MEFVFYISAIIAVIATVRVITHTNPVHGLLYLVVSLIAISAVFFSLGAYFAAALEIIVYAGAIMVLFVFVVMILNLGNDVVKQEKAWLTPRVWLGPSILCTVLLVVLIVGLSRENSGEIINGITSIKSVGIRLFSAYVMIVELASMLLLSGVIVAYHLGRENKDAEAEIAECHKPAEEEKA